MPNGVFLEDPDDPGAPLAFATLPPPTDAEIAALGLRLAALLPAPYQNLVRWHGVFANRSRFRNRLPAAPPRTGEPEASRRRAGTRGSREAGGRDRYQR